MKLTKLKFLFLPALISIFSCSHRHQKIAEKIKTIDLSQAYNSEEEVLLSSIADSISYISLQTDSTILLDQIKKPWMNIQFTNNRIFVNDKRQLLTFDYSGKFINRIGRQGNGPGEFIRIDNFTIIEKKKEVVIMNLIKNELLIYDFKGAFIRSVKNDFWSSEIASLNKEFIVLGNTKGNRISSDYYTVLILDNNYQLKNRLIRNGKEKEIEKEKRLNRWQMANFYNYCDTLSHWEFQYDTIWRIPEENIAYPVYKIELGKDKFPFNNLLVESSERNQNEFVSAERVFETKNYFFMRIIYKGLLRHILYRKEDNSAMCINHIVKRVNKQSFINDIDGGLPFWPDGVINGDRTFSIIYGYQLVSKLNENEAHKTFQPINTNFEHLARNAQLFDNPIIMIVKMKKCGGY